MMGKRGSSVETALSMSTMSDLISATGKGGIGFVSSSFLGSSFFPSGTFSVDVISMPPIVGSRSSNREVEAVGDSDGVTFGYHATAKQCQPQRHTDIYFR